MTGEADAEDLAQDIFIRVYRALPAFRGESSFRTWMYRIARNVCLSELRKRGTRAEHFSLEEEGEEKVHGLLSESVEGLEEAMEREDLGRRVRELVMRLSEPYRSALTLHYFSQLKYEEIAGVLEVPLGTVKTLIHRGRLRLRSLFLREAGGAECPGGLDGRKGA
jgi:RNA polymerase sigma-70 factor (ECF subfamily)